MSKLSKVLSVLLAMVLLFSTASVGVEAAYSGYKDNNLTRYDSVDKPVLDVNQYASMAMDEIDRMLGEANIKIEYDVAGLIGISLDLTSIDRALDDLLKNWPTIKGALPTLKGDLQKLNFSALFTSDDKLAIPKRTTSGKTDKDIFLSLLKFLKDNAAILAKVPKGSTANGGLDLGPVLSGFIDLGEKLDVPKLVKGLLAKYVWPDTEKDKLDLTKTLDQYLEIFIDEMASGDYAKFKNAEKFLIRVSNLLKTYLPGLTDQIDLLNDDVYTIINKGLKIALNSVAIPWANTYGRVQSLLLKLSGYELIKKEDADGDPYWVRPANPKNDEPNAMENILNLDVVLTEFPVDSWGDDWIFDHLNDIIGQLVRQVIKSDIQINWSYANGNADLKDNVISVAKTILKSTGDALFADYIEVLTPAQIDAMQEQAFLAYVLRSILNASISFMYIPNTCDTVLKVLVEMMKQLAADFVPWRDYSALDPDDVDSIVAIGLDMAVYGLKGIVDMNVEYGMDAEDFADEAMDWVIENYGGFVGEDVEGSDGWEKLSTVVFNIIPANWLSTRGDGSERDNLYDLLMDDIVEKVLDLDFDGLFELVAQNPDGELTGTIIEVVLARLTGIVNYVLPGVFPTSADYSHLENLLGANLLSSIIQNLLSSLYDRANGNLLNALLPVVCAALDLSDAETFGYPYISLEDQKTVAKNVLTSFYVYNGSSGLNTNATDKFGNKTQDKLYTYIIDKVETNIPGVTVSPNQNITINGGTSQTFTLGGVADADDGILKVTITYRVKGEKGTFITQDALTATTYTYIHDKTIVPDDEKAKADKTDKNTHLINYKPTLYLSKGSKLSSIADYTVEMQRNKFSDSTLHNQTATFTATKVSLDPNFAALGVTGNLPFSFETQWNGLMKEFKPYKVAAANLDTEIPFEEGKAYVSYTNNLEFTATATESDAETIYVPQNIFVYDDYTLGSLLKSAVNADRQQASYGTGSYEAKYLPFDYIADPSLLPEEPKDVEKDSQQYKDYLAALEDCYTTETVNGAAAWTRYVAAVEAAAAIVYAPKLINTMQAFVDYEDDATGYNAFGAAAYELYVATKELDACSESAGTAGIKSALDAIVAPDTFINDDGEEETYDYDDVRHTYFGRADYISYTYSNFKSERRAAERVLDDEKAAEKKGEPYQIESIRAAYLAHRVSLYGERLIRVKAYKRYLDDAIKTYKPILQAGQAAGNYNNKTWNEFTRWYDFAVQVNNEPIGSTINSGSENLAGDGLRQTKVNEARAQLVKAAKRLTVAVPQANVEALRTLLTSVKATKDAGNGTTDKPTYEELPWNSFVEAYDYANGLVKRADDEDLEDTDLNRTKVSNAYTDLDNTFKALADHKIPYGPQGSFGFDPSTNIFTSESAYSAITYVTGLDPDYTWVTEFLACTGDYSAEVELNDYDMESTGAILKVYESGNLIGEYAIVVYSDINGDGVSDPTDMTELVDSQGFAGLTDWENFAIPDENPFAMAADLNHDATIDGTDNSIMADIQGYAIIYNQSWVMGEEEFEYI